MMGGIPPFRGEEPKRGSSEGPRDEKKSKSTRKFELPKRRQRDEEASELEEKRKKKLPGGPAGEEPAAHYGKGPTRQAYGEGSAESSSAQGSKSTPLTGLGSSGGSSWKQTGSSHQGKAKQKRKDKPKEVAKEPDKPKLETTGRGPSTEEVQETKQSEAASRADMVKVVKLLKRVAENLRVGLVDGRTVLNVDLKKTDEIPKAFEGASLTMEQTPDGIAIRFNMASDQLEAEAYRLVSQNSEELASLARSLAAKGQALASLQIGGLQVALPSQRGEGVAAPIAAPQQQPFEREGGGQQQGQQEGRGEEESPEE